MELNWVRVCLEFEYHLENRSSLVGHIDFDHMVGHDLDPFQRLMVEINKSNKSIIDAIGH